MPEWPQLFMMLTFRRCLVRARQRFMLLILCSLYPTPKYDKGFNNTFTHLGGCRDFKPREEWMPNKWTLLDGQMRDLHPFLSFYSSSSCMHNRLMSECRGAARSVKRFQKSLSLTQPVLSAQGQHFEALLKEKKKSEVKDVKKEDRKKQTFSIFATHVNWSWWPK